MGRNVRPDFHLLFDPRSIALIGASKQIQKWGAIVLLNILFGGYRGRIYPVNPREEFIFGNKAYPSVNLIPDEVDLAIIAIPARGVLEALQDCIRKGIRMVVVITSGFSETGPEGVRLERELVAAARTAGVSLVGPNTMGIFSASSNLIALMPPVRPTRGRVSLVSQSGNIGTQILAWGKEFGLGFNKYVSSGNEGDLHAEDYLSFFGEDTETGVILAYMEGLDNGRKYLEIARGVTPHKPIIAMKGGKTAPGARAAQSHSGALAGVSEIYQGAFRQAGVLFAKTPEEMLEWAAAFSTLPLPQGNRVAILTRGGGWGVIAADACTEERLQVLPLGSAPIRALDKILPPYWSHGNPVDMVASISIETYIECLSVLMSSRDIDFLISLSGDFGLFKGIFSEANATGVQIVPPEIIEKAGEHFSSAQRKIDQATRQLMLIHQKPVFAVGANIEQGEDKDGAANIFPHFRSPERAAKTAGKLYQYSQYVKSLSEK